MRAMVLERPAGIETSPLVLREWPDPLPASHEVRVRVTACAICRTDLHVIEGDLPDPKLPLIPGHQVVGVVDRVGEGCRRLQPGQRVGIAWLRYTDGVCSYCRRGRENLCPQARFTGYHADGGYAEYAVALEEFVYELPEALSDVDAAPLLCAGIIGYRALERASVPEGGKLLLVGFGSSAHLVLQLARHRGYAVSVVTRGEEHCRHAREMGAVWAGQDFSGLPSRQDSAILFAPVGALVPPTLEVLDRGGILSLAGIYMTDVPPLDYERHLFYEREVRSVTANTRADGHGLLREAAAAGVRPHVTEYALEQANQALQDLKAGKIQGTGVLRVGM